jgi:hypothetical protein
MKIAYYAAYVMAFVFLVGETARRGISYFSINATTMFEDYFCGILLLIAAWAWAKKYNLSEKLMVAAWAYATGGMFVPFFAHLEAWVRGVTFREDHPHEDINGIILKGLIWAICLACFIVTLCSDNSKKVNPAKIS